MPDRQPTQSILISSVRAKDDERDRLQAQMDAFLSKPGNRIQRLDGESRGQPLTKTRRELNQETAARKLGRPAERRRRSQDEEE